MKKYLIDQIVYSTASGYGSHMWFFDNLEDARKRFECMKENLFPAHKSITEYSLYLCEDHGNVDDDVVLDEFQMDEEAIKARKLERGWII